MAGETSGGGFNTWREITPEQRAERIAKGVATRKANKAKRKAEEEAVRQRALECKHKIPKLNAEIERLEKRIEKLRSHEVVAVTTAQLTGAALLKESEIVKGSQTWGETVGIYFLIFGDEVVYVGQSVNVLVRISTHAQEKDFDRFAYVSCPPQSLDVLESLYIHTLQPRLNGYHNNGVKCAPMSLKAIMEALTSTEMSA